MKLTKLNYSEWIFYLLNIIFVLLIFYPLFFVSFFFLGSEEDYVNIMETGPIRFIAFRFLFDVFFVVIMMVPIYIANIALKIILEIKNKSILIRAMFLDFVVLVAYSLGLVIGGYLLDLL